MTERDTVEYKITYPGELSRFKTGDVQITYSKVPVIILLGWANCKFKYLKKYSDLYANEGFITLSYILPDKYHIWQRHKKPEIAERLIQLLFELKLNEHPIFFHIFSNGGSAFYQEIAKSLERDPKPLMIKGVIFDSTPGATQFISFLNILIYITNVFSENKSVLKKPLLYAFITYVYLRWNCEGLYNTVSPKRIEGYFDVLYYLKSEKHRWPQHCIYSKADDVLHYGDIEDFIKFRKNLGIDITSLRFEDSPHVQHYLTYKEIYAKSVFDFICKCLMNPENPHDEGHNDEEIKTLVKLISKL